MYYSSIGILSILIHLIINRDYLRIKPEKPYNEIEKKYAFFLLSVLVYFFVDSFWGLIYETRIGILVYIFTVLFFIAMATSVWMWSGFVVAYLEKDNVFNKILSWSGFLLFASQIVILIINLFTPIMFRITKGEYIPEKVRYILLYIQAAFYLVIAVYAIIVTIKTEGKAKSHHRAIGLCALIMTLFIALQAALPLLPMYAVGCLLTACMLHSFIYNDKMVEFAHEVGAVQTVAYRDALTGVKNKAAYVEAIKNIEKRLAERTLTNFGVAVFDVNNLKFVNDNFGHDAGDAYIKSACNMICQRFKHSPVYRIGGDEFVVILEEEDYRYRKMLTEAFDREVEENLMEGQVVVSCGRDDYNPNEDLCFEDVFKRADKKMYDRKIELKDIVIH